jgi:hypothetical protein
MAIISIEGFYDTHLHTNPASYTRIGDSAEIALWCAAAGMSGIVIKSHFESTVSKVHHARLAVAETYPEFKVFSGISLNRGVGGVNPGAAALALDLGASIVWLPTNDAAGHRHGFETIGSYGFKAMSLNFKGNIRPQGNYSVTKDGKLTEETKEVIEVVRAYNAILATGHITKAEVLAVVDYALSKDVSKIMITHPEFKTPKLDISTMVNLAKAGCFMEFCGVNILPMMLSCTIDELKEMIDAVGVDRAILASDTGQPWSPRPPETLRVFAQCLYNKGISETDIKRMAIDNPASLLLKND